MGYIGPDIIDKNIIEKTLSLMKNRGPDNQSYYQNNFVGNNLLLLHSRLSIIDLDERSNQPFVKDDYVIIFNGEIYNFSLRLKLN